MNKKEKEAIQALTIAYYSIMFNAKSQYPGMHGSVSLYGQDMQKLLKDK